MRLHVATDAAGVALWFWNVDTDGIALDARAHDLWDVLVTFEVLSARIHPADSDQARCPQGHGAYEIDFRILHGGMIRWISARDRAAAPALSAALRSACSRT